MPDPVCHTHLDDVVPKAGAVPDRLFPRTQGLVQARICLLSQFTAGALHCTVNTHTELSVSSWALCASAATLGLSMCILELILGFTCRLKHSSLLIFTTTDLTIALVH